MSISEHAQQDISYPYHTAERIIRPDSFDIEMSTDASLLGWLGAVSEGRSAGGRWGPGEITHINVLELKAVLLGLQSMQSD